MSSPREALPAPPPFEGYGDPQHAPIPPDVLALVESQVECLRCGEARFVGHRDAGDCPRCRYVGWAATAELDEVTRRALRERPVERRRIRVVP